MKIKWTEHISAKHWENIQNMFPKDAEPSDFDKNFEGEVIGTTKGFWGTTYLTVACTDGKIRECEINKANIVK